MRWIRESNVFIPAAALAIIAGAAVYSLAVPKEPSALDSFAGSRAVIEGVVVRDVDRRENTLRLTVRPEKVNGAGVSSPLYVLVSADPSLDVAYGDYVRASGMLKEPEAFETDSGRTFDYPNYLRAHRVSHTLAFADVEVVGGGRGSAHVLWLLSIKRALLDGIEYALPEPHAALAEGLLLGEKQSLGDRLTEAFRRSGVVHIIVLSGYNVALVVNAVLFVALRVLPRVAGYTIAAAFVVGFAVMTGGAETTIRATVMALLMMVARAFNRPAAALRGLFIAAASMALINPFIVLYDLSFQLSVVATLGLILFTDAVKQRLPFLSKRFGLREIVATTIATQITVLPLLILSVGAVSLVFLPANALILPAVPLAMLFSFLAALASLVVPSIALPLSFAAWALLAFIIRTAEFFGSLPFAALSIPPGAASAALSILFILYAALFIAWSLRRNARPVRAS